MSHHHQSPSRVIATSHSSDSLPPVAHQIHYRQSQSGHASQQRSTQNVSRGSARGNYRETNISNHEVEDEHIDDALYPEDVSRHNKRAMCDRTSLTKRGYTSGQASHRRSTQGGGTRSIRENNGHQELNTLNDKLGDEHIDDVTREVATRPEVPIVALQCLLINLNVYK
ncbi:Uncharacterized protein Fot_03851 [Forsythia ovata]|uniref:Uncharacterized protein n=1 Tax=Forsythia ovata TaxID=205694 RepID=A0ABD1XBD5_9LAMI